jgi:tripartite-type tricarboxylate transporter receptor subunit TctC
MQKKIGETCMGVLGRSSAHCVALAVLVGGASLPATAQSTYPARPVTLVVPFGAGGASDVLMRVVAQQLGRRLSTTVVVENRAGANGNIGLQYLSNAPPDGYTIGVGATASLANNPAVYKRLPYDPDGFVAIAPVGTNTAGLVIHNALPATNLRELVALMKSKRQHFSYGSAGIGNSAHLTGELFKRMAGVEMEHVPYRGGSEIIRDLISGQIQLAFSPLLESIAHIKSGSVRVIGVGKAQRSPHLPDVPTITEGGVPGIEYATWQGLIAPKGTPASVVRLLNETVRAMLADPEMQETLRKLVVDPLVMSPEEFEAFIAAERKRWGEIAALAGAVVE